MTLCFQVVTILFQLTIYVCHVCVYTYILFIYAFYIYYAYACTLILSCVCMGCSSPGSSVHGIFQAIILEWVAISYSRFPDLGIEPIFLVSLVLAGGFFTIAPRESPYIVYMCIYYLYINIMYSK